MRERVAWRNEASLPVHAPRSAGAVWLATGHGLLGACAFACTAYAGSFAWVALWLGAAQLFVAHAYFTGRATVFGKRADGTLAPLSVFALLPHLLQVWGFFWLKLAGLRREPCHHRVAEGIVLGRKPFARELPPDCGMVLDLTAEFPADPEIVATRRYLCLPVLNRHVPSDEEFRALLDQLQRFRGCLYVHCGAGRGRSAMVVAALLVQRGLAHDAEDAERKLRALRPGVRLHAAQRAIVDRCCG